MWDVDSFSGEIKGSYGRGYKENIKEYNGIYWGRYKVCRLCSITNLVEAINREKSNKLLRRIKMASNDEIKRELNYLKEDLKSIEKTTLYTLRAILDHLGLEIDEYPRYKLTKKED